MIEQRQEVFPAGTPATDGAFPALEELLADPEHEEIAKALEEELGRHGIRCRSLPDALLCALGPDWRILCQAHYLSHGELLSNLKTEKAVKKIESILIELVVEFGLQRAQSTAPDQRVNWDALVKKVTETV